MEEQKETFVAKFIHKPYIKCCENKKELLKAEQGLILYHLKKYTSDDYFRHYINEIQKLNSVFRTIVFYGVPIRLSKQRFSLLYLLLIDGYISSFDYLQISNLCNNKNSKKISNSNLKSFISKFKKHIIKQYSKNKGQDKKFIANKFDDLVYYESYENNYTIKTKFSILQKAPVKKQKKEFMNNCKNEFI